MVLNYGFADRWEVVAEGRGVTTLNTGMRQTSLVDDQVSLKGIVREGSLQERSGPSIAVEFGLLLPEVHGEHGAGLSGAAIVSQAGSWGAVHFNAEAELTRDKHAELFLAPSLRALLRGRSGR